MEHEQWDERRPPAGHAPSAARLEDIAARVGVSSSEVSRVLNGRVRAGKSVGAATRARILEAARDMNYSPHRAAQNLVRGRTYTAALMMVTHHRGLPPFTPGASPFIAGQEAPFLNAEDAPGELSPHYHEIIGGLTYALHQYGFHLTLARCGGPDTTPLAAMEQIARSRMCDGMVITDMLANDPRPHTLEQTGLPYVVRGTSPTAGAVAVGMDNVAVGYQAIRYLHGLGHRRILFYNILHDLMVGQRRYEGVCQARDEFGLGETLEYQTDVEYKDAVYLTLRRRLQQPDIPTAVFAKDELSALGARRAIAEAGLRVPEDISVMSCLNAPFMRLVAPDLTVLNVRQNESAAQAGVLLARLMRGEPVEKRQILLSPLLEERGSTAPPPR